MGRNKLNEKDKKTKISVTLNTELLGITKHGVNNISKYLEWLIYQDLKKNNKLSDDFML
jgi:LDH2 family malate/lactate/ureidoglycolate dehydrogenase